MAVETRPEANSPDTHRASRVVEGAEARLGNAQGRQRQCQAANTPAPCRPGAPGNCGSPQGLGKAQTGRKDAEAARNSALLVPARGEPRHGTEWVLSDHQTGCGLTLRSCRVTSIAPRLCKSPNPSGSVAVVLADASQRSRQASRSPAAPAPRCQLCSLLQRRCCNPRLGKWLFYEWEGKELQCARAPPAIL